MNDGPRNDDAVRVTSAARGVLESKWRPLSLQPCSTAREGISGM